MAAAASAAPKSAVEAVLVQSEQLPSDTPVVRGYDFNRGVDYEALFASFSNHGFQATNLGLAIEEVNRMLRWRLSDEPRKPDDDTSDAERAATKCTIFLAFTSNMGSCGNRDVIRYLCQHKLVQCVVTTAGAVEEDIMKCKTPHYIGDFHLSGRALRKAGINRLGNLLVPNANYCAFEDFVTPLLTRMLEEQKQGKVAWTPSRVIKRLGEEVRSEESFCYWCARNDIPVFCPALTDGSLGDMIFFHSFAKPGLVIDIVEDLRAINSMALFARKTGMIILGGGVVKHHTCNANLMRNGADFSVFINTAADFDGSDAGAQPDEAISWGKIRMDARPVKVHGDAALIFPLLVAQTFAKEVQRRAAERGGAAAPAPAPAPATKH